MAIDKSKYIGKFTDEGLENISVVESLLFEIREGYSAQDDLVTLMRALHTLKGSARMLEFKSIETLAHAMETVFSALKEERITLGDNAVRLLLAGLDELKTGIHLIKSGKADEIRAGIFQKELLALSANEDFAIPDRIQGEAAPEPDAQTTASTPSTPLTQASQQPPAAQAPKPRADKAQANKRDKVEELKAENIRVSLERVNEIIRTMASLQGLEITARKYREGSGIHQRGVAPVSEAHPVGADV